MTTKSSNHIRPLLGRAAVLAACLLSVSFGVAHAATTTDDVPTVVVAYSDLDLGTENGVRTLYKRISNAADQVCPFEYTQDPKRLASFKSCRDAAIARAVRQIKSPALAALSAEHVKRG